MEPRARAGKNVGKMNFTHNELAQLLYAHGDSKTPLPETVRVLDEIVTDFMQGISFEATRVAHHAGRQKVKFDDFQFAMRKNPRFMGKIQETFEKKKTIENLRKGFDVDEQMVMRDAETDEKHVDKDAPRGTKRARPAEEELGEGDDDLDAEADIGTASKKR